MSPSKQVGQVGQDRAGQGKHTCSARHWLGPQEKVTSGGSSEEQMDRVVREVKVAVPFRAGKSSGPGGRGGAGRGTWPRAACEAEAGNVQRAERVHVRDCRAEGEGQLGREGQGTVSCGMPPTPQLQALDGAMDTLYVHGPAWRAALAAGEHGGKVCAIGWRASVSLRGSRDDQEGLSGDGEGVRKRGQKPQRVTAPEEGGGEEKRERR